jgi:hypothetical protein
VSNVRRPRGPLPPRVYWTRRGAVIGLALLLVFGVARLLGGTGGAEGTSARPVGADASVPAQPAASSQHASPGHRHSKVSADPSAGGSKGASVTAVASPTKTPLAVPTGPCSNSDVRVVPGVHGTAAAGRPVTFVLDLSTLVSAACTWDVSSRSLVVKLTSGSDRIWSTQDCTGAIGKQSVVVRRDHTTRIRLTWTGQRSDGSCSRTTPWAMPGYYHVQAAAFGAEPTDVQFELHAPAPATITPKPHPKTTKSAKPE